MLDHHERDRWRAAAGEKLRTADLLREAQRHADACVLYEQTCRLALKAALRGLGVHDRRRDLDELARAVAAQSGGVLDEELAAALSLLARDYIPARYPDAYDDGTPDEHYSAADADRASSTTASTLAWADAVWEELSNEAATEDGGDTDAEGGRSPGEES